MLKAQNNPSASVMEAGSLEPRRAAYCEPCPSGGLNDSPLRCRRRPTAAGELCRQVSQTNPLADGQHCRDFGSSSLRIGEVILSNFFADRDHDALPADHRAHTECESDRDFDLCWNEFRGVIDVFFEVGNNSSVGSRKLGLLFF
jgi:hypothetical protein